MKDMLIVDFHNHPDWHKHDLDKYLANMDQYGISKTCLLTWECPRDEYDPSYDAACPACENGPISFARCLSYVERCPERFYLGYAPDPRKPEAIDQLKAAVDIYGVKVYGELKIRMMLDNMDAIRMYRFCGELGLPVVVHIDYEYDREVKYPRPNYWYGGGIEAFERAIKACPDTLFVGHAPGFWAHISDDGLHTTTGYPKSKVVPEGKIAKMMRAYPNLYCDLSAGSGCNALRRDREYAKIFLTEFQDRIFYGRDFFDNQHQEFLNSLDLERSVLEKIYSGNTIRILGLEI